MDPTGWFLSGLALGVAIGVASIGSAIGFSRALASCRRRRSKGSISYLRSGCRPR